MMTSLRREEDENASTSSHIQQSVDRDRRPSVAFANFDIQDTKSSLAASVLVLFALTQLLCGVVLPLSDAFSMKGTEGDHKYYLEIFFLAQYIISVSCILYLTISVHLFTRKMRKEDSCFDLENLAKNDYFENVSDDNNSAQVPSIVLSGENQTIYPLLAAQTSPKNHVSFGQNLNNHQEGDAFNGNGSQDIKVIDDNDSNDIQIDSKHSPRSLTVLGHHTRSNRNKQLENPLQTNHKLQQTITLDNEGVNLYLRLGSVGFGFGVMMHDGLKISDEIKMFNSDCRSVLWIPKLALHFFYVFIQTYFLFKYHRVSYNSKKTLTRFIMIQLAVTNLCQWFKTVIFEIGEEMRSSDHANYNAIAAATKKLTPTPSPSSFDPSNITSLFSSSLNVTNSSSGCHSKGLAETMSFILFPCAIEYSLIAGAIFYKMFQKIGSHVLEETSKKEELIHEHIFNKETWTSPKKSAKYSECHKSHKGLFLGLVLFMVTCVALALFFMFYDKQDSDGESVATIVYQYTEIGLQFISLVTCFVAIMQLRVLAVKELNEEDAFDVNLLLVGLVGILCYNLFLLIPALETIELHSKIAVLFVVKSIIEILQSLAQSFLILETSRRCADSPRHVRHKPGRSMLTFLFVANLAMWLVNTFEVKRSENNAIYTKYYSGLTWSIVTHMLLPLIIFFRFHSTVCLSDIWSKAYRIQKN